jgi:hypothetical protein
VALVELGRFSSGIEAAIISARLEADGIPTACFDTGMNIAESVGIMIPVRIMVDEDHLEAARAIIRDAEAQ